MTETGIGPAELTEVLGSLTADQSVKMVRELCAQLADSGEAFHGDIWPGNVRMDETGKAVLGEGSDAPANSRSASQVEYLAPEYFWDNAGDGATDVYSLGMLLYAGCNGGYLPFQPKGGALTEKDRSGALRKRMKGELITTPSGMSRELAAVLRKSLSYEPEDRYASPAALLAALGETDEALPSPELDEAAAAAATAAVAADELAEASAPEEDPFAEFDRAAQEPLNEAELVGEESPWQEEPAEETPAEEPAAAPVVTAVEPERKYTVQKDFEKTPKKKAASAAPATRQKKKKKSALIPVLCVAAAAVIGGTAWYTLSQRNAAPAPADEVSEAYVIIPAESPAATEAPTSLMDENPRPSLDDDPEPEGNEDVTLPEEEPITGSATVDGQDVTPVSDTVYVTGSGVNLRSGPGTAYEIQETLTRGTELQRTGTVNGWSQVQYEGGEYYISSALITDENPDGETFPVSLDDGGSKSDSTGATGTGTGTAANGSGTGNTNSNANTTANTGANTNTTANTGTSTGSAPAPAAPTVTATRDIVGITGAEVNLRSGPGTGNSIVTTVPSGTILQRTGTVNGWSRVVYKGQEVYVSDTMIGSVSADKLVDAVGTLKVTSDVNVRSGANTDSSILSIAKVGESLTVTGVTEGGKWYKVSYNGQEGYVNRKLVSVQELALVTEQSGTAKVTTRANVRSGPGTGYEILGIAEVDDTLTITGYADNNWYKVSYNDKTGYIAANLVTKS